MKWCSGHPKTCKSIKNQKWKVFTKPILSSIFVEESDNNFLHCYYEIFIVALKNCSDQDKKEKKNHMSKKCL